MELREHVVAGVHAAGYRFVTLDLLRASAPNPSPFLLRRGSLRLDDGTRRRRVYNFGNGRHCQHSRQHHVFDPSTPLPNRRTRFKAFRPTRWARSPAQSGVDRETVTERIAAMPCAGTILCVRQTLMATNLARETPLNQLDKAALCPGSAALDKINASLR